MIARWRSVVWASVRVAVCGFLVIPTVAAANTLTVDTSKDELTGRCSLREAIEAVDAPWRRTSCGAVSRRSNVIVLKSGRYELSIQAVGTDDNTSGDLNVTSAAPLTIVGAGASRTVIDGSALGDRVLTVGPSGRLTLAGITVTGGSAPAPICDGGGIFNAGALVLGAVDVTGDKAGGSAATGCSGGGVYNQGGLVVIGSTIYGNRAGGDGGGIFSASGSLTITNSTFTGNSASGGGAIASSDTHGFVRNATVADNAASAGGGLDVAGAGVLRLQNTIVASNLGGGCAGSGSAIVDGGHDLSYGDRTCPGSGGNPRLGPLMDNGGPTKTMAIGAGSAAIDQIPRRTGGCPSTDQRGVLRPQGRACDAGAYEFALPTITIGSPVGGAFYERGSRIFARFRCSEGGITSPILTCTGSARPGHQIITGRPGTLRFEVTALDRSGHRRSATVKYNVFEYVNPVRDVVGLTPRRIDLGVDYAGSGPLLAIGSARVTMASNSDSGPPSCWAISCWPGGGIVVYRLLDGPFAGRYVYVAEHITVSVRAGQTVRPGEQVATLHPGYPWSEWGWAAGPGPEALAMADGHWCPCSDPGDWSTIDGRTMNQLLVSLGAPSGLLQATPAQSMPHGWPRWPA